MRHAALLLLLFATPGLAEIDPDPDGVGVYFDQDATVVVGTAAVGEEVDIYLIATNPTRAGGLALWESGVAAVGPYAQVWGWPTNGFNTAMNMPGESWFHFIVFGGTPMQQLAPITVLAHLVVRPEEPGTIELRLLQTTYRLEDLYTSPDYPLYPSSGSLDLPVAVVNGEAPVAVEAATWGALKSLYR